MKKEIANILIELEDDAFANAKKITFSSSANMGVGSNSTFVPQTEIYSLRKHQSNCNRTQTSYLQDLNETKFLFKEETTSTTTTSTSKIRHRQHKQQQERQRDGQK